MAGPRPRVPWPRLADRSVLISGAMRGAGRLTTKPSGGTIMYTEGFCCMSDQEFNTEPILSDAKIREWTDKAKAASRFFEAVGGEFYWEQIAASFGATLLTERADVAAYREGLEEIRLGRGAFSRDKLEHAVNCIDAMRAVAVDLLAKPNPGVDLLEKLEQLRGKARAYDDSADRTEDAQLYCHTYLILDSLGKNVWTCILDDAIRMRAAHAAEVARLQGEIERQGKVIKDLRDKHGDWGRGNDCNY